MKCECSKCGKRKTVKTNNLKKRGRTPENYVCIDCALKMRRGGNGGPQKHLEKFKNLANDYVTLNGGTFK